MSEVPDNSQKEYDESKSPFSWDKLDGLLAFKSSLTVCSELLDVSDTTIKKHLKDRYGQTFGQYSDRKLSRTKVKLVQKALEQAYGGNSTMLIFCLKNLCNWADKQDSDINHSGKIEMILPSSKLKDV